MSAVCLICLAIPSQSDGGSYSNNATLASGKTLQQVLTEILGQAAIKSGLTTTVLCHSCYQKCVEYHGLSARLTQLKTALQTIFYRSKTQSPGKAGPKAPIPPPFVCLPASKLRPLPSQYVFLNKSELNTGKLTTPVKQPPKPISISPTLMPNTAATSKTVPPSTATQPQMKQLTIDALLLSQLSESKSSLTDEIADTTPGTPKTTESSALEAKSTTMLNFDINDLPKDFLDTPAVLSKTIVDSECVVVADDSNNDGEPMEIDKDCLFNTEDNTATKDALVTSNEESSADTRNVFEVNILSDEGHGQDGGDGFVVKKMEITEDGEDAEDGDIGDHTLLVEGEDGEFIRVMAGQKFLYGDNEISLILPDDDDNAQDQSDNADSNDESQIELQVSGDEETANAIMAAAREQGGAIIKVRSGEVYRVKSVKSKMKEEPPAAKPIRKFKRFNDVIKKVGNAYKCLVCAKESNTEGAPRGSFRSREGAARHLRITHDVDVNTDTFAAVPVEGASKKGAHECTQCLKTFVSRNLLREHINQHNGTRPYSCAQCGKSFASKYTHQAHLKTHEDRPRPFKCTKDGCGKSFLTVQNLTQHKLTHAGVKDFVCQTCGKAFGTAHNLEVHGLVHSGLKPFLCGICCKSFARKAEIRDHIRTHTGERPFACDICGATFSQRSNLQSHVRATHNQDKRHACTQCEKKFKRRRLLEYHVKSCHTGERPFRCDVCTATFVYPEHYKKHALIHSGERPYVCEVCGKSFNSRDNRNAHRFVHSDKKPYECLVCGSGYMRKPLLYAHMHSSGHMTESIVVNQPRVTVEDQDNETLFETVGEDLDLGEVKPMMSQEDDVAKVYITDKKMLSDGKSTVNLVQDSDTGLITLAQNLAGSEKIEPSILESLANEELGKGAEIVAKDENGEVVRLVQIQLPSGENGWIAIN